MPASSSKWIDSSATTPCPVCNRDERDCLMAEDGETVCCHTRANPDSKFPQPSDRVENYQFTGKIETRGVMDRAVYVKERERTGGRKPVRPKSEQSFLYPSANGRNIARTKRVDDGKGERFIWQDYWIEDDRLRKHRPKTREEKNSFWVCVSENKVKAGKATAAERQVYQGIVAELQKDIHLYRISEARNLAETTGLSVLIVEGEGIVNLLLELGIPATTSIGGAGKWRQYGGKHGNYKADLKGLDVVLCPDCDRVGIEHMSQVAQDCPDAQWLYANPTHRRWQSQPSGGYDLKDWVEELKANNLSDEAIRDRVLEAVGAQREFEFETEKERREENAVEQGVLRLDEGASTQDPEKPPKQSVVARKLAGKYRNQLVFSCEHDVWFKYELEMPGAWSAIKDEAVKALIQKDLEDLKAFPGLRNGFSASYRDGVYSLTKLHQDVFISEWKSVQGVIPFRNGVFNMTDRSFTPSHSPRNFLTYSLPRNYETTSEYPAIENWLDFVFAGDVSSVQQFNCMAAAMLRRMWYLQKFLHLQGKPGGGKSTAQRLITSLIGEQNTVSSKLEALAENKFETARLIGKPLCILADQDDYRGNIGTFLQVTGNDKVRSERKNRDGGEFTFEGMACVSSNGPVFVSRTGREILRRQILLMFNVEVLKPDPKFADRLIADLPGWTNYLLSIPEVEIVATLNHEVDRKLTPMQWEVKKRVDSIAAWLEECVVIHPEYQHKVGSDKTDTSTLFGSYQTFCKASDGIPKGLRDFSEILISLVEMLFPEQKFEKHRTKNGWIIKGISLRGDYGGDPYPTDLAFPKPKKEEVNNEVNSGEQWVKDRVQGSNADEIRRVNKVNNKTPIEPDMSKKGKTGQRASEGGNKNRGSSENVHLVHQSPETPASNGFHCSPLPESIVHPLFTCSPEGESRDGQSTSADEPVLKVGDRVKVETDSGSATGAIEKIDSDGFYWVEGDCVARWYRREQIVLLD